MSKHERGDIPVLGEREGISVGTSLRIAGLPVPGPVAVGVVVARVVFVDPAIPIVVESFIAEQRVLARTIRLRHDHQAGIGRVGDPAAVRVRDPHLNDVAVSVEVVGSVLIDQPVAVVVPGVETAAG